MSIWLSNFFFLISAVPYYVGVQLSHPSFAYCLGNTGAYFFIWLAGIRFSGFTVTERSLGSEIFKSVNFGIVILDYNGKLSLINRYARAHLNVAKIEGQSLDKLFDITSEDIEELFSEIDTSDILERKWKAIDGEKIFNVDITTKRDKKGDIICIIIAIADITREEEMILKITSADREKSEFLKRIAHEVRTPLNTILVMDRLIIRKSKDEELSAYAKDINKAGQTMLSLINDAFNISEEAIEEINYSEFDYDELEDNNGEPEYFSASEAKILVVDDIDMNLNVFKGILKVTEIDVRTASSGAEAIELIKAEPFDIIFMDHMMPVMDGVECMQIIRRSKDHPYKTPPNRVMHVPLLQLIK